MWQLCICNDPFNDFSDRFRHISNQWVFGIFSCQTVVDAPRLLLLHPVVDLVPLLESPLPVLLLVVNMSADLNLSRIM